MAQQKDPIGEVLGIAIKGIGYGFKNAFYGIKKLNRPLTIFGFLLSGLGTYMAFKQQNKILALESIFDTAIPIVIRYLIYWTLLLLPLFYLMILGKIQDKKSEKYKTVFADIGFIGKDKKYPYLLKQKQDNKKIIFTFKSNIPLVEWKKSKDRLETGLDCSIRQINAGVNKKIVELVTVPSDFKIPEVIRWDDSYIQEQNGVVCIGESDLQRVTFDLNRTPHVLAAGETGSGKSVVLRSILWQMINQGCKLYMIDFKGGVEFGKAYERFGQVITERETALTVLQQLVNENEVRLKLFRELEVKNLKEYNQKTKSNLCRIGVFIDEIAEMLDKKGVDKKEKIIFEQLEGALSTLARLSRATGINLFLGVQRPDANVLTGQIKNNIPVRISGRFADKAASEIVLGNTAATELPDIKGRFLYKMGNEIIEFQGYWFDDEVDLKDVDIEQGEMLTEKYEQIPTKIISNKQKQPLQSESKKSLSLDFNFDDKQGGAKE